MTEYIEKNKAIKVSHMDGLLEYGMSYQCACGHAWSVFFKRM